MVWRYCYPPRPGKGRRPRVGKGSKGWDTRLRNDAADTGAGWVYVLTGMGGLAGDKLKVGQTRNHPAHQAESIMHTNFMNHWTDEREIRAKHRTDPPQLWASRTGDRKAAKAQMSQMLITEDVSDPDLATILRVMAEVAGDPPARYPLIPPTELSSNVPHAGIDT